MTNPRQYKIPDRFLNIQKDIKDGKCSQITSNNLENKLREDLERLKRFVLTEVSDITGVCVCVVNIPKQLGEEGKKAELQKVVLYGKDRNLDV
ncbi:hypothetical protein TNCV_332421 [Trichonephila clavipes]|nr:hypothetical protein TNCV_332421 [Trichonephila clavipes]